MLEYEAQNELMELFIDFPAPYPRRLANLRSFLPLGDTDAYEELCILLDQAFQFFYTKKEAAYTIVGVYLRTFTMLLGIAAIANFNDSHKDGFDSGDVMVSYILLCSTLVLEICALVWLADWRFIPLGTLIPEMQRMVAQFNLVGFTEFVAGSRWLTVVRWLGMLFGCKGFNYVVGQYCYPQHCWSTPAITKFIRGHLKDGWVNDLGSAAGYWRFNDRRGEWTLQRDKRRYCEELGLRDNLYEQVVWSVTKLPFYEAILIWHIPTHICLDHYRDNHIVAADERASAAREISDYMMYLLLFQADMLMPGTQQSLFAAACSEIRHVLGQERLGERELIVGRIAAGAAAAGQLGGHVADARWLAGAMTTQMNDAGRMLKIISGVWVEMICYSASRCRHAKSLGAGGEFLTVVWLLLHRMGIEGLADNLQRSELPEPVATAWCFRRIICRRRG